MERTNWLKQPPAAIPNCPNKTIGKPFLSLRPKEFIGPDDTVLCRSCRHIFEVDACTEENLVLKNGVLVPVCPNCGAGGSY